jgi:hypothetical protein
VKQIGLRLSEVKAMVLVSISSPAGHPGATQGPPKSKLKKLCHTKHKAFTCLQASSPRPIVKMHVHGDDGCVLNIRDVFPDIRIADVQ